MMVSSKLSETKGIGVVMVIEVIGRPPEHLKETLDGIIKQIDEEKGVVVKGKTIHQPVLMKDQKDFYTSFAEVEIEVEEIHILAILMFKYMPAHIEVIYPEFIALTNNGWGDIFSEVTRRLHGYDEVARILEVEKRILETKLREVIQRESNIKNQEEAREKPQEIKKNIKQKKSNKKN